MVVPGDDRVIEQHQATLQVSQRPQVHITEIPCVERELMLLKVNATSSTRKIVELSQIFRARVVDRGFTYPRSGRRSR